MKSSIKILTVVAILLVASISSYAQRGGHRGHGQGPNPEQRAERAANRMIENLELNEQQAAEVKAISLAHATKMKEARDKIEERTREELGQVRAGLETELDAQLKNVLTADQFNSYLENKAKRKEGRKGKGKRKGEGKSKKLK